MEQELIYNLKMAIIIISFLVLPFYVLYLFKKGRNKTFLFRLIFEVGGIFFFVSFIALFAKITFLGIFSFLFFLVTYFFIISIWLLMFKSKEKEIKLLSFLFLLGCLPIVSFQLSGFLRYTLDGEPHASSGLIVIKENYYYKKDVRDLFFANYNDSGTRLKIYKKYEFLPMICEVYDKKFYLDKYKNPLFNFKLEKNILRVEVYNN